MLRVVDKCGKKDGTEGIPEFEAFVLNEMWKIILVAIIFNIKLTIIKQIFHYQNFVGI